MEHEQSERAGARLVLGAVERQLWLRSQFGGSSLLGALRVGDVGVSPQEAGWGVAPLWVSPHLPEGHLDVPTPRDHPTSSDWVSVDPGFQYSPDGCVLPMTLDVHAAAQLWQPGMLAAPRRIHTPPRRRSTVAASQRESVQERRRATKKPGRPLRQAAEANMKEEWQDSRRVPTPFQLFWHVPRR